MERESEEKERRKRGEKEITNEREGKERESRCQQKVVANTQKVVTSLFVIPKTFFPNKVILLLFHKMLTKEEVWMCKLRKGLREILSEKLSLRQAAEKYGIG